MVKWYGVLLMIRFQNNSFTCSFLRKSVAMLWIALWLGQHKCASGKSTSSLGMTQKKTEEISFQYSKTIICFKKEVTHTNDESVKFHTHLYSHLFPQHKQIFNQHLYWNKTHSFINHNHKLAAKINKNIKNLWHGAWLFLD